MSKRPHLLLIVAMAAQAFAGAASAQNVACQIARSELAAHDRGGGHRAQARASDELQRLVDYYYAAGCAATSPFTTRPPQCGQVRARIAKLEIDAAGGGRSTPDPDRRADLRAAVDRHCKDDGVLSASSRSSDSIDAGSSRVIVDENGVLRPDAPQSQPQRLGRAVCVRSCDGFYFPLTSSPGGREGADEMCQALCPASPTRAFFIDAGSIDNATDLRGKRYAATPTAFLFRKQISSTCGCRRPGETWSSALKRADELAGPQAESEPTSEPPQLRPGASANAQRGPRVQAIDPSPREDAPPEPEFVPPEPSGVVVMRPAPAAEQPRATPTPGVDAKPKTDEPKKPARVVGPPVTYDGGRPQPIQSR